jgi:DNA-binding response OmpR family regulator
MPTLLIVEDDRHIRQFVALNLKARGYMVLQAENAEDGLHHVREHAPDGLILVGLTQTRVKNAQTIN